MQKKCLCVAIAGLPNAGKSTFVNSLVRKKVSIVTKKPQTTRITIRAVYCSGTTQLVFLDTPGLFHGKKPLEKLINHNAVNGIRSADVVLLMVDPYDCTEEKMQRMTEELASKEVPVLLLVNKSDVAKRRDIDQAVALLKGLIKLDEVFVISALEKQGVKGVLTHLLQRAPVQEWLFAEGESSNLTPQHYANEMTREKLFELLHKELPYSVAVCTEQWREDQKSVVIHQVIYVSTSKHKSIVVGKKGQVLKQVGVRTRLELEQILGKKISLFLFVKVKDAWQTRNGALLMMETGVDV